MLDSTWLFPVMFISPHIFSRPIARMGSIETNYLPCTTMSPGLDGWRHEQRMRMEESSQPQRERNGRREEVEERDEDQSSYGIDQNAPVGRERAIRSFKFALVEHFKDALKPHYNGGKISKDAHKIIIKKSLAKVIESCGTCGVPENDEAIRAYLRSSHSKLSKLIQAYVEKYQKLNS